MEYGIFNDEGCIVSGYWSRAEAEAAMAKSGLMTGEEADEWKDRMKDESMGVR